MRVITYTNHITCVIIGIIVGVQLANPESNAYNSLWHSKLQ